MHARGRRLGRSDIAITLVGLATSAVVGYAGLRAVSVAIGVLTLLPVAIHLRVVGWSRAFSEPSAATIVVLFYLSVFPLRALAFVAGGASPEGFLLGSLKSEQLTQALLVAAFWTSLFVACFHRAARSRTRAVAPRVDLATRQRNILYLAGLLMLASLIALPALVAQAGGLSGAISAYSSHSKDVRQSLGSSATSVWASCSIPAIWCTALVLAHPGYGRRAKLLMGGCAATILAAQLVIFGSRLNAILSLIGVWVVYDMHGRRPSLRAVAVSALILVAASVPILASRTGGPVNDATSTIGQYSAILGYSVLDISLAVEQRPDEVRREATAGSRWSHLPGYMLPHFLGFKRHDFEKDRMDAYVVRAYGTPVQQDSGFPMSATTESWLYGGWIGVAIVGVLAGFLFGGLQRILWSEGVASGPRVIWACFATASAFSYFKDGDVFSRVVSDWRSAEILAAAMVASGVWALRSREALRSKVSVRSGGWRHLDLTPRDEYRATSASE